MRVTLLGTGDTTGTPTVGCDCETCDRARELGVERTRFSVHVYNETTDESVLIDASPDFRTQFLREHVPLPDAAVITHIHFDHLDGLGNTFRLRRELPVYASDVVDEETGRSVAGTIEDRYDYLRALSVRPIAPYTTVDVCSLELTLVPVVHPPLLSYGLVITDPRTGGRFGMTGDTSYAVPAESREAFRDVDLLLADGIAPASFCGEHPAGGDHHDSDGVPRTFGTKHMTREGARSFADEVDADRLRIVHASHFYPPDEAFADPIAVDGERFEL